MAVGTHTIETIEPLIAEMDKLKAKGMTAVEIAEKMDMPASRLYWLRARHRDLLAEAGESEPTAPAKKKKSKPKAQEGTTTHNPQVDEVLLLKDMLTSVTDALNEAKNENELLRKLVVDRQLADMQS